MVQSTLSTSVGAQVRTRREQRGMSAAELARRAGVSKATMSGIEAGSANPTIETLDALAVALGIPLTDLFTPSTRSDAVVIPATPATGEVTHELLRRISGGHQVEIWRLRLPAGGRHDGVPHAPGTTEHLVVADGSLTAGPVSDQHDLGAGDLLAFPGDVAHTYVSRDGADVCVILASPIS